MKTNHGPSGYGRLNGKTRVNCINHPLIEIRFKRREWNSEKHHEKHPPVKTRISVLSDDLFGQGVSKLDMIDVVAVSLITLSLSIRIALQFREHSVK